ncbi:MAG: hypothetical protein ABIN67_01070 [Ferruginibacter sp.]
MTIHDKKVEVLTLLSETNDVELIEEVYSLLHPSEAVQNIEIKELPDTLQQKINKAIEDYKSGNYITHDEMKQKVQQWLTK